MRREAGQRRLRGFLGLSEAPSALTSPDPCRYSVEGFIDKNRDSLFQDFKRLLYNR